MAVYLCSTYFFLFVWLIFPHLPLPCRSLFFKIIQCVLILIVVCGCADLSPTLLPVRDDESLFVFPPEADDKCYTCAFNYGVRNYIIPPPIPIVSLYYTDVTHVFLLISFLSIIAAPFYSSSPSSFSSSLSSCSFLSFNLLVAIAKLMVAVTISLVGFQSFSGPSLFSPDHPPNR